MTNKFDVTTLGEILIDFTESDKSDAGMRLLSKIRAVPLQMLPVKLPGLERNLLSSGKPEMTCMAYSSPKP